MRSASGLCATVTVALVLVLQALTIHYNRGGRWSALYFTAADRPLPEALAREDVFRFPTGYDGQQYHLISHDPFFRRGFDRYLDDPRLRYRRILVPLGAWLLAGGRDDRVDLAYRVVLWLWTWLGAFWLSRAAVERGRSPWWGLAFVGLPAVIVSLERMTADVALAALAVAFARWGAETSRRSFVVLLLAPLVRETGLIFLAGAGLWHLCRRQRAGAGLVTAAAMPVAAWYAFVHAHTPDAVYPAFFVPLRAILDSLAHAMAYAASAPLVARLNQLAEALGLLGILIALALVLGAPRRWPTHPAEIGALLFALLAALLQRPDNWQHVYDYGRVFSPMLLWLGWRAWGGRERWVFLPTLLMYPRIALQLASQAVGIALGMAAYH